MNIGEYKSFSLEGLLVQDDELVYLLHWGKWGVGFAL